MARGSWLVLGLGLALALPASGEPSTEAGDATYVELGVGGSYLSIENHDFGRNDTRTYRKWAPRLEGTLYRTIGPGWDIGTGLVFDWVGQGPRTGSLSLLGFRLVELKQHWTPGFATRYFFTVDRLYRELPAYGYGGGLGLQARMPGLAGYSLAAEVAHSRLDLEREEIADGRIFTRLWTVSVTLRHRF